MKLCPQLEAFVRSLADLKSVVDPASDSSQPVLGDGSDHALLDRAWVCQQAIALQATFQALTVAIEAADLDSAVAQRLRPYQTEAHRRLRLMSVESMRLRTARQPETLLQGRLQLTTHLDQLHQFMQAIAAELCGPLPAAV